VIHCPVMLLYRLNLTYPIASVQSNALTKDVWKKILTLMLVQ